MSSDFTLKKATISYFKGIGEEITVDFAANGTTLISGDNETGKSSIIDAIVLLMEEKYTNKKKDTESLYHKGVDEPITISLNMDIEGQNYTLTKAYDHGKSARGKATLVNHATGKSFSGGQAEEEWDKLHGSIDKGLFKAMLNSQGSFTFTDAKTLELQTINALTKAIEHMNADKEEQAKAEQNANFLDGAAADVLSTDRDAAVFALLVKSYGDYWTAAGRPRAMYKKLIDDLSNSKSVLKKAEEALSTYQTWEGIAAKAKEVLSQATDTLGPLESKHTSLTAEVDKAEKLRAEFDALTKQYTLEENQVVHLKGRLSQRETLAANVEQRAKAVAEAEAKRDELKASVKDLEEKRAELEKQREEKQATESGALAAIDRARIVATILRLQELKAVAAKAAAIVEKKESLKAPAHSITEADLSEYRQAHSRQEILLGALKNAAGSYRLSTSGGTETVSINGEEIQVSGVGQEDSLFGLESIQHGDLSISFFPPNNDAQREELRAVEATVAEMGARLGVSSLEQLIALREETVAYEKAIAECETEHSMLLAPFGGQQKLEGQIAQLEATTEGADPLSEAEAKLSASEAEAAIAQANEAREQIRAELAALDQQLQQVSNSPVATQIASIEGSLVAQQKQVEEDKQALDKELAELSTEDLQANLRSATIQCDATRTKRDELAKAVAEVNPDLLREELGRVEAALRILKQNIETAKNDSISAQAKLDAMRGTSEDHAIAEAAFEESARALAGVERKANAIKKLYDTVMRCREEKNRQYAAPFVEKLTTYGAKLFGSDFNINMDEKLGITGRSDIDFLTLSGGAKEQLAFLRTLVIADMVAEENRVPVIIDDALGNSDSTRLERMGALINELSEDKQVIILTCSPERFATVSAAVQVTMPEGSKTV
ncbi:MAG: AAA family ATPase [Corynebacterium sp.]|nr:AAA family ATPase [Corynebacterium sp.]